MEKYTNFAVVIKDIRQSMKLNQKEFGEKLGYSYKTVSAWEKGKICPLADGVNFLELLEKNLGINTDNIIKAVQMDLNTADTILDNSIIDIDKENNDKTSKENINVFHVTRLTSDPFERKGTHLAFKGFINLIIIYIVLTLSSKLFGGYNDYIFSYRNLIGYFMPFIKETMSIIIILWLAATGILITTSTGQLEQPADIIIDYIGEKKIIKVIAPPVYNLTNLNLRLYNVTTNYDENKKILTITEHLQKGASFLRDVNYHFDVSSLSDSEYKELLTSLKYDEVQLN